MKGPVHCSWLTSRGTHYTLCPHLYVSTLSLRYGYAVPGKDDKVVLDAAIEEIASGKSEAAKAVLQPKEEEEEQEEEEEEEEEGGEVSGLPS